MGLDLVSDRDVAQPGQHKSLIRKAAPPVPTIGDILVAQPSRVIPAAASRSRSAGGGEHPAHHHRPVKPGRSATAATTDRRRTHDTASTGSPMLPVVATATSGASGRPHLWHLNPLRPPSSAMAPSPMSRRNPRRPSDHPPAQVGSADARSRRCEQARRVLWRADQVNSLTYFGRRGILHRQQIPA